jgi:hypothetical protein
MAQTNIILRTVKQFSFAAMLQMPYTKELDT